MADIVITDEVVEILKTDGELFGKVADALGVSVFTLPDLMRKKSRRLTEIAALNPIAEKLGKEINDLVEPAKVPAETD